MGDYGPQLPKVHERNPAVGHRLQIHSTHQKHIMYTHNDLIHPLHSCYLATLVMSQAAVSMQ